MNSFTCASKFYFYGEYSASKCFKAKSLLKFRFWITSSIISSKTETVQKDCGTLYLDSKSLFTSPLGLFFLKHFYFIMLNINEQTKFQNFSNISFYAEFLFGMHIWIINNSRRRGKTSDFNVSKLKTLISELNKEKKY